MNRVILIANLTRDPELRHVGSNAVANIGVAVNRRYKTADGERREETTFIDCEAWGKTAENINQYFSKGKQIAIEGRLKLDQWEKDGQKFSKLKVVIDTFHFVGGKSDGDSDRPASRPAQQPARNGGTWGSLPDEDDIPF